MEGFDPVKLNPIRNKLQLASKSSAPILEVGDLSTYQEVERGEIFEQRKRIECKTKII